MTSPAPIRFARKFVVDAESGCWLWTGYISPAGYGRFNSGPPPVLAHRWAYEYFVGPIPEGLQLDHLCRVTNCVNPDHLEPVTGKVNTRRGGNAIKTHCPHGHPYSGTNLYVPPRGGRQCHACMTRRNASRSFVYKLKGKR